MKTITTTWGFSAAALAADWYHEIVLENAKEVYLERHHKLVEASYPDLADYTVMLVESKAPVDGIEFRYVTEVPE